MCLNQFFPRHSPNLNTETEAAYENYKSYDEKSSILWFSGMITNKRWWPAENRAHKLLLVILRSK